MRGRRIHGKPGQVHRVLCDVSGKGTALSGSRRPVVTRRLLVISAMDIPSSGWRRA